MQLLPQSKYKTIAKNFTYLSILNGLDIALPLLIIPYLTNVIGATYFGKYSFILAVVQTINILTSYGYLFSATKKISQNRDNKEMVNKIMNAVIGGRICIATTIIIISIAVSKIIFKDSIEIIMFISSFGMIFGDIFIPTWLFQGLEKMKYVTIVNATSKIIFTIFVVLIVTQKEDYKYILLMSSIGSIIAATLSMWLVKKMFALTIKIPAWKDVRTELKDGLTIFMSTLGMTAYRNLNIIILNYFVNNYAVGIYALAEKIIKAIQSLINPLSQALYPYFGYKAKICPTQKNNIKNLAKIACFMSLGLIAIVLAVYILSDYIVIIIGKDFIQSSKLVHLMLPVVVFGCLNYLLGFVGLINLNKQRYFLVSVIGSGTISILVLVILTRWIGIEGAAYAMSLSEFSLFLLCATKLIKIYKYEK